MDWTGADERVTAADRTTVLRANLVSHLREHGGVAVRWPRRKG